MRGLPCLLAVFVLAAGAARAQPPAPAAPASAPAPAAVYKPTSLKPERGLPRTPDGHPDLQGVVWDAYFFAPLQAPAKGAPPLVLGEAQARKAHDGLVSSFLDNPGFKAVLALDPEFEDILHGSHGFPIVRGERRSRLVVLPADGRLPLTAEGAKASQISLATMMGKMDNPEERGSMERCISLGAAPPVFMLGAPAPREFIQTRDHVIIHSETGDELRIVPFAASHGPGVQRSPLGDSIARWEGDTLVVETTHFPATGRLRFSPTGALVVNQEAKVTERFTRVSRDELVYQFTVEDPKVYGAPWLGEYSFYRAPYPMFPSPCHEGNYSMANILAGARVEERAAAAAATKTAAAAP